MPNPWPPLSRVRVRRRFIATRTVAVLACWLVPIPSVGAPPTQPLPRRAGGGHELAPGRRNQPDAEKAIGNMDGLRIRANAGLVHRAAFERGAGGVAVCLVGELRTFGLPMVARAHAALLSRWRADVFVYYHTRHYVKNGSHRGGYDECGLDEALLHALRPVALIRLGELPGGCTRPATVQFHSTASCFKDAYEYSLRYQPTPYRTYVRLRPDMLVRLPNARPPDILPNDTRAHTAEPKHDMAFALSLQGAVGFIQQGVRKWRSCPRTYNWEFWPPLKNNTVYWPLDYVIVRGGSPLRFEWARRDLHASWLEEVRQQVEKEPGLVACAKNYTAHPAEGDPVYTVP